MLDPESQPQREKRMLALDAYASLKWTYDLHPAVTKPLLTAL
jgi:hypothetical protein